MTTKIIYFDGRWFDAMAQGLASVLHQDCPDARHNEAVEILLGEGITPDYLREDIEEREREEELRAGAEFAEQLRAAAIHVAHITGVPRNFTGCDVHQVAEALNGYLKHC